MSHDRKSNATAAAQSSADNLALLWEDYKRSGPLQAFQVVNGHGLVAPTVSSTTAMDTATTRPIYHDKDIGFYCKLRETHPMLRAYSSSPRRKHRSKSSRNSRRSRRQRAVGLYTETVTQPPPLLYNPTTATFYAQQQPSYPAVPVAMNYTTGIPVVNMVPSGRDTHSPHPESSEDSSILEVIDIDNASVDDERTEISERPNEDRKASEKKSSSSSNNNKMQRKHRQRDNVATALTARGKCSIKNPKKIKREELMKQMIALNEMFAVQSARMDSLENKLHNDDPHTKVPKEVEKEIKDTPEDDREEQSSTKDDEKDEDMCSKSQNLSSQLSCKEVSTQEEEQQHNSQTNDDDNELEYLRKKVKALQDNLSKFENDLAVKQERIDQLEQSVKQSHTELQTAKNTQTKLQSTTISLQNNLESREKALLELQDNHKRELNARAVENEALLERKLRSHTDKVNELQQRLNALRNTETSLREEIEREKNTQKALENQKEEFSRRENTLKSALTEKTRECSTLQQQLNDRQTKDKANYFRDLSETFERLQSTFGTQNQRLNNAFTRVEELSSDAKATKENIHNIFQREGDMLLLFEKQNKDLIKELSHTKDLFARQRDSASRWKAKVKKRESEKDALRRKLNQVIQESAANEVRACTLQSSLDAQNSTIELQKKEMNEMKRNLAKEKQIREALQNDLEEFHPQSPRRRRCKSEDERETERFSFSPQRNNVNIEGFPRNNSQGKHSIDAADIPDDASFITAHSERLKTPSLATLSLRKRENDRIETEKDDQIVDRKETNHAVLSDRNKMQTGKEDHYAGLRGDSPTNSAKKHSRMHRAEGYDNTNGKDTTNGNSEENGPLLASESIDFDDDDDSIAMDSNKVENRNTNTLHHKDNSTTHDLNNQRNNNSENAERVVLVNAVNIVDAVSDEENALLGDEEDNVAAAWSSEENEEDEPDWSKEWDKKRQRHYYWNWRTETSVWKRPAAYESPDEADGEEVEEEVADDEKGLTKPKIVSNKIETGIENILEDASDFDSTSSEDEEDKAKERQRQTKSADDGIAVKSTFTRRENPPQSATKHKEESDSDSDLEIKSFKTRYFGLSKESTAKKSKKGDDLHFEDVESFSLTPKGATKLTSPNNRRMQSQQNHLRPNLSSSTRKTMKLVNSNAISFGSESDSDFDGGDLKLVDHVDTSSADNSHSMQSMHSMESESRGGAFMSDGRHSSDTMSTPLDDVDESDESYAARRDDFQRQYPRQHPSTSTSTMKGSSMDVDCGDNEHLESSLEEEEEGSNGYEEDEALPRRRSLWSRERDDEVDDPFRSSMSGSPMKRLGTSPKKMTLGRSHRANRSNEEDDYYGSDDGNDDYNEQRYRSQRQQSERRVRGLIREEWDIVRAFSQCLKQTGIVLKKYGKKNIFPNKRTIWLDDITSIGGNRRGGCLRWQAGAKNILKAKSEASMPVCTIEQVTKGMKTEVLRRRGKKKKEDLYFSLISAERTLDFEASSSAVRDELVIKFKLLATSVAPPRR